MKILIILGMLFGLSGCAINQVMKDCRKIEGTEAHVCKTTKPWESL